MVYSEISELKAKNLEFILKLRNLIENVRKLISN